MLILPGRVGKLASLLLGPAPDPASLPDPARGEPPASCKSSAAASSSSLDRSSSSSSLVVAPEDLLPFFPPAVFFRFFLDDDEAEEAFLAFFGLLEEAADDFCFLLFFPALRFASSLSPSSSSLSWLARFSRRMRRYQLQGKGGNHKCRQQNSG